ncbi:MAG: glycoside hydrolase family 32 protein [Bacillota bacterium]|nr:glycoside hydrolase family 32 protein [Bacillota bacterium]
MKRPNYRLTAWQNWTNDPNGLIYACGRYHAFYQHHPYDPRWGPMHWGHATSPDLYRWTQQPIALYPDENGTCFSGSAVLDSANTSGLGDGGNPVLVLIYTSHPEAAADGRHYEAQSLAWSRDGETFMKYNGNPVIPNNGVPDFRDPKVFWHAPSASWICVLAAFDRVAVYRSPNLIDWTHASDFGPGETTIPGVWECPDLFPLELDGETHWVLLVSLGTDNAHGRGVVEYFIGDFDGQRFVRRVSTPVPRLLDQGSDLYAVQTFANTEDRILLGWAANPGYAGDTPTTGFCGQLSAPRLLSLYRDLNGQPALAARPVPLPADIIAANGPATTELPATAWQLDFTPPDAAFRLELSNDAGECLSLAQSPTRLLSLDRSQSGNMSYSPLLELPQFRRREVEPRTAAPGHWQITLDGPLLEIYADDGSRVLTQLVYPSQPYTKLRFEGLRNVNLTTCHPYEIPQAADPFLFRES